MFIDPRYAIQQGWIKGIANVEKQVQPNAVDFTLDVVKSLNGAAIISEKEKVMRELQDVPAQNSRGENVWTLDGQSVYDGTSNVYVEVPPNVAAILFTRSTFARNGILIASGLYDSGYRGQIGFTIYTHGGPVDIEPGTRIGQVAFIHSESAGMYAGGWNHEQGSHYTDKKVGVPPPVDGTKSKFL